MGTFYRTIRMVDNGIKPVYVFDGKPPEMKSGEVSLVWLQQFCSDNNYHASKIIEAIACHSICSWQKGKRNEKRLKRIYKKPQRQVRFQK